MRILGVEEIDEVMSDAKENAQISRIDRWGGMPYPRMMHKT
jgi:hypothetical protein